MDEPYDWPEIFQSAVEALDSELEWQLLGLVYDKSRTADEIVDELDISHQAATTSVSKLTKGGLVSRRNMGELTNETAYYVELSEYGSRFIDAMFDTLGSIEDPTQ